MSPPDCTHTIAQRPPAAPGLIVAWRRFVGRRMAAAGGRAAEIVLLWMERARQRRELAELSDRMLRDIGLTRTDAWAEADKPFWRP